MPGPLSRTSTRSARSSSAQRDRRRGRRPGSQNLTALDSRLSITCMMRSTVGAAPRHRSGRRASSAHVASPRTAGSSRRPRPRSPRAGRPAPRCHSALPGLDLGEVEHLVDEARQALGLLDDDAEELARAARRRASGLSCRISENARIEVSGVRSSCVTVEMKSSFSRSSSCSRSLAARSSCGRRLELARLLLEVVAVGDDLRGLVEDVASPRRASAAPPSPPRRP